MPWLLFGWCGMRGLVPIHSFVAFWLENLSSKKWKTFVRRKVPKGVARVKAKHNRQQAEASQ